MPASVEGAVLGATEAEKVEAAGDGCRLGGEGIAVAAMEGDGVAVVTAAVVGLVEAQPAAQPRLTALTAVAYQNRLMAHSPRPIRGRREAARGSGLGSK
jgi:hypothetical protein